MSWPRTPEKHGHANRCSGRSPTYRSWCAMHTRCSNRNVRSFQDYGGRGISVCERWKDFGQFLADMGERPDGTTLERIDNEVGYSPANCRWASRAEQNRNTKANVFVEFEGERITQAEFARRLGLKQSTVSYRMRRGWTVKQIAALEPNVANRVASKLGEEVEF